MTAKRKIALDIEMTGLYLKEGHRIVEIAAIELIDDRPTGREAHFVVNPGRDIPAEVVAIHGITNEGVKDKPPFAAIAPELHEFIGASMLVITCRTDVDGYTGDVDFLNAEMSSAGLPPFLPPQWLNVRRWAEAMYGMEDAGLNKLLDRYGIDKAGRDDKTGHGALIDARLLAALYPRLAKDYADFLSKQKKAP